MTYDAPLDLVKGFTSHRTAELNSPFGMVPYEEFVLRWVLKVYEPEPITASEPSHPFEPPRAANKSSKRALLRGGEGILARSPSSSSGSSVSALLSL